MSLAKGWVAFLSCFQMKIDAYCTNNLLFKTCNLSVLFDHLKGDSKEGHGVYLFEFTLLMRCQSQTSALPKCFV